MSLSAATPASSPRTARLQIAAESDARNGSPASARRALRMVDSVSLSASAKRPSRVAATERTASAMPCSAQFDARADESAAADASVIAVIGSPATSATSPRRVRTPPIHHGSAFNCDASWAHVNDFAASSSSSRASRCRPVATCTMNSVSGSSTSSTRRRAVSTNCCRRSCRGADHESSARIAADRARHRWSIDSSSIRAATSSSSCG